MPPLHLFLLASPLLLAGATDAFSLSQLWSRAPKPPKFPDAFEASYTFSLPYVYAVQTLGLSFHVKLWYDGPGQRLRTDVYGGLDSTLAVGGDTYLLYPRINETVCEAHHDAVGPTLAARLLAAAPLPDISAWHYGGETSIGNAQVHIWQLFDKQFKKTSTYTFYATPDGTPVRLSMMGFNIMSASHFDEYLVDFSSFKPLSNDESVFDVPQLCGDAGKKASAASGSSAGGSEQGGRAAAQAVSAGSAVMPWAHIAGAGGSASSNAAGARPGSTHHGVQALRRLKALAANAEFVRAWNARVQGAPGGTNGGAPAGRKGAPGFKLALNRFADALPEEVALLTAKRSSAHSEQVKARSLGVVALPRGVTKRHLPKKVTWRGTPADNVVKDQATCGSCWAFSAVGAMQGAWFLATDEVLSLSEQQLVDCSWDYGNDGCQGGEMEPAIQYIADAGGAATEEDYQYRGQNMFCGTNATRRDFSPAAKFKGFANVKRRDESALMYAVWRHGPVAISIDASLPSFRFYDSGVYRDSACKTGRKHMDHAVLLVGYGTDEVSGEDYWLVKNSWSKYWGDDGYIKMARTPGDGNDCGVTTDPVLAVVHPVYAKPGSPAAQLLGQLQQQQQPGVAEAGQQGARDDAAVAVA